MYLKRKKYTVKMDEDSNKFFYFYIWIIMNGLKSQRGGGVKKIFITHFFYGLMKSSKFKQF